MKGRAVPVTQEHSSSSTSSPSADGAEPTRRVEGPDLADVTVVVPTRNRISLLLRTLRSVRAQRDVRLRIIVVDDGSTDGTESIVGALGDDRITVLRHEQARGVSAARNAGIREATSEWVAFTDDDDLWAPDKLSAQLQALQTPAGAGWSCVGAVHIDDGYHKQLLVHAPPSAGIAERLLAHMQIPGGGSGVVARTDLMRAIGGFDESISVLADWDCYIRLALAAPLAPIDRPLVAYYQHRGAMSLDVRRAETEFAYLQEKYDDERATRSISVDRVEWLMWLAGGAYRGHERRWGSRRYLQALRLKPTREMAVRVAKRLMPERLRALKWILTRSETPETWAQDMLWLDRIRDDPANAGV